MTRITSDRSRKLQLSLLLVMGGLSWCAWHAMNVRWYRDTMVSIATARERGLNAVAARRLRALLSWQPDSDEAAYLLGLCERDLGHPEAADAAWSRVPPDSAFAPQAILGRFALLIQRGRISESERLIQSVMDDPRRDVTGLGLFLGPVYSFQGRDREALRVIERRWEKLHREDEGASEAAINLVRLHNWMRRQFPPVAEVRAFLDQAARASPGDERVWLGQAHLATRTGSFDEALRRLDACLQRRPDDLPVWHARLTWALAADRVPEFLQASTHLPASDFRPAEIPRLAAWLAAHRGDFEAERRSLERLLAIDPSDRPALDRLAELAAHSGHPDRAAELRRRKAAIERLQARYQELIDRNQPLRDAAELSRLAQRLGDPFEARGFLAVALSLDPDRDDLRAAPNRLSPRSATTPDSRETLADSLARVAAASGG